MTNGNKIQFFLFKNINTIKLPSTRMNQDLFIQCLERIGLEDVNKFPKTLTDFFIFMKNESFKKFVNDCEEKQIPKDVLDETISEMIKKLIEKEKMEDETCQNALWNAMDMLNILYCLKIQFKYQRIEPPWIELTRQMFIEYCNNYFNQWAETEKNVYHGTFQFCEENAPLNFSQFVVHLNPIFAPKWRKHELMLIQAIDEFDCQFEFKHSNWFKMFSSCMEKLNSQIETFSRALIQNNETFLKCLKRKIEDKYKSEWEMYMENKKCIKDEKTFNSLPCPILPETNSTIFDTTSKFKSINSEKENSNDQLPCESSNDNHVIKNDFEKQVLKHLIECHDLIFQIKKKDASDVVRHQMDEIFCQIAKQKMKLLNLTNEKE